MMPGPPGSLRPGSQPNDLGRPLPKTFQQNTIVPNKGTMVEDDDDSGAEDDDDAFNLEGAAARRQTNKSAKSMGEAQGKIISDLENQLSELQGKVGSLEESLRDKDAELQKTKEADSARDTNTASERAEWDDLRYSLEEKVEKAENLNTSLRSEIDRLRIENADMERNLPTSRPIHPKKPTIAITTNGGNVAKNWSANSASSSRHPRRCAAMRRCSCRKCASYQKRVMLLWRKKSVSPNRSHRLKRT
jgi:hypothetical protein